jgi:hypothetical protein
MSDVSFRQFIDTARISGGGNIRFAKGEGDEVINKGGFGHSVASFFQSIGRGLGLMRPDPTLAQRQSDALDRFKDVLTGRFGAAVANAALHATGLDAEGATLTGRSVIAAADQAMAILAQNRQHNLTEMQRFLPPGQGEQPSEGFAELAALIKPKLEPAALSPEAAQDYTARLRAAVEGESRMKRQTITPERMKEIAKDTLKQVVKLERLGEVQTAAKAQQDYVAAVKSVIVSIGRGDDPAKLVPKLEQMSRRFETLLEAEQLDEAGGAELNEMTERAMFQAIRELRAEQPGLAEKAQHKLLADGSSMMAVVKAANDGGVQIKHGVTNNAIKVSGQVIAFAAALANGFQVAFGSVGTSGREDSDRVADTPGVSPKDFAKAKLEVAAMMDRAPPDLTADDQLLRGIQRDFRFDIDPVDLDRRVAEHIEIMKDMKGMEKAEVLHSLRETTLGFPMREDLTQAVLQAIDRAIG